MKSLNLVPGYTTIDNSEKAIAIYRRYMVARKGETKRDEASKSFFFCPHVKHGKNAMSAQIVVVSLLRVATVLRIERDAWPMVK